MASGRHNPINIDQLSIKGERCLIEEKDLGIVNGKMTTNVLFRDVLSFKGLYAPPFVSSDFLFNIRLFGEKVPSQKYTWFPHKVCRNGSINGVTISSTLALVHDKRALVLSVTLHNLSDDVQTVPIQCDIQGTLDCVKDWLFVKPTSTSKCQDAQSGNALIMSNSAGSIVLRTDIQGMQWRAYCSHWDGELAVPAKDERRFGIVVAVGNSSDADLACCECQSIESTIETSDQNWSDRIIDLYDKVPEFKASDRRLEVFYNRSLSHFLLNQWRVPEFVINPYYSTGSINGGCVGCYLWDFGEGWEIFSLYDPDAVKEHIKSFLAIDLTAHFAFTPLTGAAFGPWYYINQEKIIGLVYYYVAMTGDRQFLDESVNGKSIIDHMIIQASYGEDLSKPVALIDYGSENHHLELRKGTVWEKDGAVSPPDYIYDHMMPDLNGRRYNNYCMVSRLCDYYGIEFEQYQSRAEDLKQLIKAEMWSERDKWLYFIDNKGHKDIRYTIQIYKLIGSNVLNKEQENGLLSHLNEDEFLSDYGIHSISKRDPAYDQNDIDNGGGGSYAGFPSQVIERLYKAGYPEYAEDIFQRILWWGERMPYWGDSFVANHMDYRKDTPLQNTIGSISGAQSVIYGMFGVCVDLNGTLTINPCPPSFSQNISLTELKIRGRNYDIYVAGDSYSVHVEGEHHQMKVGDKFTCKAK
jgi:hypothetical protein